MITQLATVQDEAGNRIGLGIKNNNGAFSIQTVDGIDVNEGFIYASQEDAKEDIGMLYHSKEWDLIWDI